MLLLDRLTRLAMLRLTRNRRLTTEIGQTDFNLEGKIFFPPLSFCLFNLNTCTCAHTHTLSLKLRLLKQLSRGTLYIIVPFRRPMTYQCSQAHDNVPLKDPCNGPSLPIIAGELTLVPHLFCLGSLERQYRCFFRF